MNITISHRELDALRREVSDWRTTAALVISAIEDAARYNHPLDQRWVRLMLRDVRQDAKV